MPFTSPEEQAAILVRVPCQPMEEPGSSASVPSSIDPSFVSVNVCILKAYGQEQALLYQKITSLPWCFVGYTVSNVDDRRTVFQLEQYG
jgi:hypothetical protein